MDDGCEIKETVKCLTGRIPDIGSYELISTAVQLLPLFPEGQVYLSAQLIIVLLLTIIEVKHNEYLLKSQKVSRKLMGDNLYFISF